MKKSYLVVICLFLGILIGCQKKQDHESKRLEIVTSFYPIYAITKEVSGALNQVKMVHSSNGIHTFEPSASDIAMIYDADVFIYHSPLLEPWAKRLEESHSDTSVTMVEASKTLNFDRVSGLEEFDVTNSTIREESLYDPHTWTDPILVGEEAVAIAEALSQKDPKNQAVYMENAKKLQEQLVALTETYQQKFQAVAQKTFVTQHTAFAYLAKRFGLKQVGIAGISNEQEPSPKKLAEMTTFVKQYQVKTIFAEEHINPKIAETLARETQTVIKYLNPLEVVPNMQRSYLEQLSENLTILYEDLAGERDNLNTETTATVSKERTLEQVDAEEGSTVEQVIIAINDEGYVTSHGDHFHFYNGSVPYEALFNAALLIEDPDYNPTDTEMIQEIAEGYVIKKDGRYSVWLLKGASRKNIRS